MPNTAPSQNSYSHFTEGFAFCEKEVMTGLTLPRMLTGFQRNFRIDGVGTALVRLLRLQVAQENA
jgi:hypothetical protein